MKKCAFHRISGELYSNIIALGIKRQFRCRKTGRIRSRIWDVNDGSHHGNLKCLPPTTTDYSLEKSICFSTVNTRSIRNKADLFLHPVIENKYNICCVTETWLTDKDKVIRSQLNKCGYQFLDVQRTVRTGGGTGIICKQELP